MGQFYLTRLKKTLLKVKVWHAQWIALLLNNVLIVYLMKKNTNPSRTEKKESVKTTTFSFFVNVLGEKIDCKCSFYVDLSVQKGHFIFKR